jgi:3-deoxy-D-manno-octulosonic-acid transferase
LKFDAAKLDERRLVSVPYVLDQLGIPTSARLLIGGSTHPGEESVLADIFLRLRARFPDLYLVLVPRHFERGKEVGRELSARGIKFIYRSEMSVSTRYKPGEVDCLLVNTTGELKYFYEYAAVIFVGKSLTAEGGQNPIEPGAQGKAMVFGPNMQNFEAIAQSLIEQEGAVQVRDAAELEIVLAELLADPARTARLGQNALQVVRQNSGSIERTIDMLVEHLHDGEIYVTPRRQPQTISQPISQESAALHPEKSL